MQVVVNLVGLRREDLAGAEEILRRAVGIDLSDGMLEHDNMVGAVLKQLDDLGIPGDVMNDFG